jgi:predicted component of type VI protein secretion system
LEILRGRAKNSLRDVATPAFLIGAAADCDLVLGDPQFPEVHSYLLLSEKGVILRHLGFQPETAVNGEIVAQATLVDGDRIRTGPYEFQVHLGKPQSKPGDREEPARPDASAREVDRVEEEVVVGEVMALVDQIRTELRPARARLRLYDEPDATPTNDTDEHQPWRRTGSE